MPKYILVEIDDDNDRSALLRLRNAVHRTALDHDIKCRDIPVTANLSAAYVELEHFFRVVCEERKRLHEPPPMSSRAPGW